MLAAEGLPILVLIEDGDQDEDAKQLSRKVSDYVDGYFRVRFRGPDGVARELARALAPLIETSQRPLQVATGRGLGGLIGTPSTLHRFNLSIGLSIRNLLKHTNPGPIIGNITSPCFALANQIAGAQNGEGFYETANNRRLESQIKFTF